MKKHIFSTLIVFSSIIGLLAGSNFTELHADTIKKGTLTVGLEGTYAPFSYREKGKLTGYEVDVAKAVAKEINMKPKFVQTKWDSLLTGLDSNRYDVIFNNVGITKERKNRYLFAEPYLYSKTVLIQKQNGKLKTLEDIKGKNLAQSTSSNFGQMAKKNGAKIVAVPGMVEAMNLIDSGRADAELNDAGAFELWHHKNPDVKVKAVKMDSEIPAVPAAPMLNKNNPKLQKQINKAIKELAKDGTLSKLSKQYFKTDLTKK